MLFFSLVCIWLMLQLVYPLTSIMLASFFGRERRNKERQREISRPFDYACIITAYRNAAIARPLVESLLQQTYQNFTIYLVADECGEPPFNIASDKLVWLQPEEPLRLKARSIIYAVEHFRRAHDFIAVFDADNLAHPWFLEVIEHYAQAGHVCIQGQRTAKNLDTNYAALDSLGEHYKNYIEREIPYLLGGSAIISGSGMATEAALYKAYLSSPAIEKGKTLWKKMLQEDKILQNFILRYGLKIAYARQAVVYDEKVDHGAAVETQRSRWLYSYFQNIPNALGMLLQGIFRLNYNQFYFGFVTLALPMFLQLGLALICAIIALFIAPFWAMVLLLALLMFGVGVLCALWLDQAPKEVWNALWQTPKFMFRQVAALFKMGDPNKHFKHTEHNKQISVDEVLKNRP